MPKVSFGKVAAFADKGRRVLDVGGIEVAVFRLGETFFAYENTCPHMGGPVCQGKILPQVEEHIQDDKTSAGLGFSETDMNIVCPWHGYEFNIRTGQHPGNPRYHLRRLHVQTEGDEVFVELPAPRPIAPADTRPQL